MTRYAVILTHNRPDLLPQCVDAALAQCDHVIVVDNASDPPVSLHDWPASQPQLMQVPDQPPNLARLWNLALDRIAEHQPDGTLWDVAVLCDDSPVQPGWYEAVSNGMRLHGASAASTHSYAPIGSPVLKTSPDGSVWDRMCGWAFMLPGEQGRRADESMMWWWVDTDIDWQARHASGMLLVPGPVVTNIRPNDWTNRKPELAERAGLDRAAFAAKWGSNPW